MHPALETLPVPAYALPPGIEPWPYYSIAWAGT